MKKTYCSLLTIAISMLVASCELLMPANAFRAAPDSDLTGNFRTECVRSFDFSKNPNADSGKCDELKLCLTKNMNGTVLSTYNAWPVVEKIMPYSGKFPTPIADMRSNAEKAGPKAVEMFTLIYDIRKQCIIETELDEIMADT